LRPLTQVAQQKTYVLNSTSSPSLLRGPIYIDHPSGAPAKKGEEYILWDS
jgi:hypothetical protein